MHISNHSHLWLHSSIFIAVIFLLITYLEKHQLAKNNLKNASIISIIWILAALIFNACLWYYLKIHFDQTIANQKALEFFTGYLLEKSLSIDNLFVFIMIFKYFGIPDTYQRSVLHYGIMGAVICRLIMIFAGIWLIAKLHWILYVFGGFLIFSGGKILFAHHQNAENENNLNNNLIVILCKKYLPITKELYQEKFFILQDNKLYATPLFLALILIEITDIIFATDSIPAILAVVDDPFIIFTSNIFAILGLRSLYFFLALGAHKFNFLQYAIAIILIFIGIKMVFQLHLPIVITLSIMFLILMSSILLGYIFPKRNNN